MAGLVPAIHIFLAAKTSMPGSAAKFTQSAQGRHAMPGHDELYWNIHSIGCM
jgi:hypothetical protein